MGYIDGSYNIAEQNDVSLAPLKQKVMHILPRYCLQLMVFIKLMTENIM